MEQPAPWQWRFRLARVLLFALIGLSAGLWAHSIWPDDDRVSPSSPISGLNIALSPSTATISQIIYTRAKDGGTVVSIEARGASMKFEVNVDFSGPHNPGIAFYDPCEKYQLDVKVGHFARCTPFDAVVQGARDSRQKGGDKVKPSDRYYNATFELPNTKYGHYVGQASSKHGYVAVLIPPIDVRLDENDPAISSYFTWTTYVEIPGDMASVDWTEGTPPSRTSIESSWDVDPTGENRAIIGTSPGVRKLFAEWSIDYKQSYDGLAFGSVTASGQVISRINQDERDLFYSGILVGIVGAAAIALVVDAVRPWPVPEATVKRFKTAMSVAGHRITSAARRRLLMAGQALATRRARASSEAELAERLATLARQGGLDHIELDDVTWEGENSLGIAPTRVLKLANKSLGRSRSTRD